MSSRDHPELSAVSSREDVERVLATLAGRIDDLESKLEEEREERRRLEEALNDKIGRKYVALADRLEDLETSPVSRDVDEELALPIQQLRRTQKVDVSRLSPNERRAATVWGAFFEESTATTTKHVLDSSTVRTILRQNEDETPHDETVRRAMRLVGELGREYVDLAKRKGQLTLVVERAPWEDYVAQLNDSLGERTA